MPTCTPTGRLAATAWGGKPTLWSEIRAFIKSIPNMTERGRTDKQPEYEVAGFRGRTVVLVMGVVVDKSSARAFRDTYKFLVIFGEELAHVLLCYTMNMASERARRPSMTSPALDRQSGGAGGQTTPK
ncbi:MAG: hypothetical protein ABI690_25680 [Chloroflexota bacterium]